MRDQPPARRQRARQRRDHAARLELQRRTRAIGLRGDDQVVFGVGEAAARAHLIEQELVVLAIDHQHDRLFVDRIAAGAAHARAPVVGEERPQLGDLRLELVRGAAGQRQLVPDEAGGGVDRVRLQPRRLGVVHVGHHQHGRRMLEQPVGHLLQHEAHVLEADLLAHDVERHGREAVVHGAHGAGQHRAVAHAGVEQAQRRRARMDVGQFHADALGDRPTSRRRW